MSHCCTLKACIGAIFRRPWRPLASQTAPVRSTRSRWMWGTIPWGQHVCWWTVRWRTSVLRGAPRRGVLRCAHHILKRDQLRGCSSEQCLASFGFAPHAHLHQTLFRLVLALMAIFADQFEESQLPEPRPPRCQIRLPTSQEVQLRALVLIISTSCAPPTERRGGGGVHPPTRLCQHSGDGCPFRFVPWSREVPVRSLSSNATNRARDVQRGAGKPPRPGSAALHIGGSGARTLMGDGPRLPRASWMAKFTRPFRDTSMLYDSCRLGHLKGLVMRPDPAPPRTVHRILSARCMVWCGMMHRGGRSLRGAGGHRGGWSACACRAGG